ncbi:MAG: hypothetical protein Tsb0021_13820 [Chlamydiales bacterium]
MEVNNNNLRNLELEEVMNEFEVLSTSQPVTNEEKKAYSLRKSITRKASQLIWGENKNVKPSKMQGTAKREDIPASGASSTNTRTYYEMLSSSVSALATYYYTPTESEKTINRIKDFVGNELALTPKEYEIIETYFSMANEHGLDIYSDFNKYIDIACKVLEEQIKVLKQKNHKLIPISKQEMFKDFLDIGSNLIVPRMMFSEEIGKKFGITALEADNIFFKLNSGVFEYFSLQPNIQYVTDFMLGALFTEGKKLSDIKANVGVDRIFKSMSPFKKSVDSRNSLEASLIENDYLLPEVGLVWQSARWEKLGDYHWKLTGGNANANPEKFKVLEAEFDIDLTPLKGISENNLEKCLGCLNYFLGTEDIESARTQKEMDRDTAFLTNEEEREKGIISEKQTWFQSYIREKHTELNRSLFYIHTLMRDPSQEIDPELSGITNVYDRTEFYRVKSQIFEIERFVGVLTKENREELQKVFRNENLGNLLMEYLGIAKEVLTAPKEQQPLNQSLSSSMYEYLARSQPQTHSKDEKISELVEKQQELAYQANEDPAVDVHSLGNLSHKIMAVALNPQESSKIEEEEV